jgi:hypothetical protein
LVGGKSEAMATTMVTSIATNITAFSVIQLYMKKNPGPHLIIVPWHLVIAAQNAAIIVVCVA